MEKIEAFSSIVIVGEELTPSVFRPEKYTEILGVPDEKNTVKTPVVSIYQFNECEIRVVITPDRIDMGHTGEDVFPEKLKSTASKIAERLADMDSTISGMGMNANIVLSKDRLTKKGTDYCRQKFLNFEDVEQNLQGAKLVANTAKLIMTYGDVLYNVDIEPHFASQGENLFFKINAHQKIEQIGELTEAIQNYSKISSFVKDFPQSFVKEHS